MDISFITKMISPIKGLQMLKAGIEQNLKRSIDHFQIDYIAEKKDLSFKVWLNEKETIRESYSGANKEMMIFMIENLAKTKLHEGESLDLVTCEYLPDASLNLFAYVTKNGEKLKHELLNYKP